MHYLQYTNKNSDFRPAETPRDVPFLFKICTVLFKTPQLCTKPSQRGKTSCIMRYFCTRFTAIQANAFTIIFIYIISSFLSSAEADILNFIFSLPAIDFCRVPWTIQSCFVVHGNKEGQCCFAVFWWHSLVICRLEFVVFKHLNFRGLLIGQRLFSG